MLENDQNLNTTGTIVLHPGKPFFVANQSFWVKFQLYETNISASYGLKPLQSGGSQKQQLSSLLIYTSTYTSTKIALSLIKRDFFQLF